MFRLSKPLSLLLCFALVLPLLSSCGNAGPPALLGLPRPEAIARIKVGDLDFVWDAERAELRKIKDSYPDEAYYMGLLLKTASKTLIESRSTILFEAALESRNPRLRAASAKELIRPILEDRELAKRLFTRVQQTDFSIQETPIVEPDSMSDKTLHAACLFSLGSYKELIKLFEERPADTRFSSWDKALYTLATVEQANPAGIAQSSFKALFDGFFYINPIDEPFRWAYSRLSTLESEELPFSNERAVIEGRLAVARSDYGRGLREFRKRMDDPAFFLCRPALISDLGRAIQYGSARSAENQLFEDWEALLAAESDTDKADNELWETADVVLVRYRLLFYAGRIQRQLGKHDTAAALFERAIPFAQSPIDIDASIWYFLTETLRETPDNAADLALEYLPQWQDLSYFDDFLDDLSSYLCGKGQWKRIAELFYLLRLRDKGGTSAQYAYLIGRAIEEGYLTLSDITQGESGGTAHSTKSEAQKQEAALIAPFFFNIAYSNPQAPLYYRICSSIRLKTHLLPFSTDAAALDYETFDYTAFDTGALPHADDTAFLLGFFEYGARSYVSPHIQKTRVGLDTAELRIIAAAYAKDGQYTEANQLVSYYSSRENYVPTRADYQITHPRPFAELIEAQARDNKVPELVLYGLIRTESLFRETIKSSVGAEGLMQLMPATALETAARMARAGLPNYIVDGTVDSLDPDINVHIGAYYLSGLNDMFKSTVLALCAYNGGIGRVRRWRAAHPDYTEDLFLETVEFRETRSYGKRVLSAAASYGFLYDDVSMEAIISALMPIN